MRARVLLALLLAACGAPATPPPRAPIPEPEPERDAGAPVVAVEPPPPPGPCAVLRSTGAMLGMGPGVLVVDAAAPHELGACISPPLVLEAGEPTCDPSGLRCRIGDRDVLLARELGDTCVPMALVAYDAAPPDVDAPEIEAALSMRDEACALHDRVVRGDDALYADVTRARRIAPAGRRGELAFECLTGEAAGALAREARGRFLMFTPLRCSGLRCVSEWEPHAGSTSFPAPPGTMIFAHRLAGPLRFDGVAWLSSAEDQSRALQLLRRRCR